MLLALLWFFIFLAFLSIAATKRQLYLLPAFPAAALLLGNWLAEVSKSVRDTASRTGTIAVAVYSWALVIAFLVLGGVLLWVVPNLESLTAGRELTNQELEIVGAIGVPLIVIGVTLILSACVIGAAWRLGGKGSALLAVGGTHVAIYVVILSLLLPTFAPAKTYEPQSRWIMSEIGDAPRFGMVDASGFYRRGGFGFYTGTAIDLLDGPSAAIEYLRQYPNTIVLVRSTQFERDFAAFMAEMQLRVLREIRVGSHLYIAVAPAQRVAIEGK